MKKLTLFIILSFIYFKMNAQGGKDIVPPSPTAKEFQKYIDYPVQLYTGIPDISVPIYQIESGNIKLPISISYHSAGFRPDQETGIVGYGWSLNAGASLSRTIHGERDELHWNKIIPLESDITSELISTIPDEDWNYLNSVVIGSNDSQYDIFYYSLLGQSGKFIFKRDAVFDNFLKPILFPYKPIRIVPHYSATVVHPLGTEPDFEYFDIINDGGMVYRFGKSVITGQVENEQFITRSADGFYHDASGISNWLLTEIISPDMTDTVYFKYEDIYYRSLQDNSTSSYIIKSHRVHGLSLVKCSSVSKHSGNTVSTYSYSSKVLSEIKFKNGKIAFSYRSNYFPDNLLDNIKIYSNKQLIPLKTVNFTQTAYHSDPTRINKKKLDEIVFVDKQGHSQERYSFVYKTDVSFPLIDSYDTYFNDMYDKPTNQIDYWGFYNGASNTNLIPPVTLPNLFVTNTNIEGDADRNSNETFMKAGILLEVHYPTGGYTKYDYEANVDNAQNIGGLRIKSIESNTEGTTTLKKSYDYFFAESAFGNHMDFSTLYRSRRLAGRDELCPYSDIYAVLDLSSEPTLNINSYEGSPAIYNTVVEYIGDANTNTGKITHDFDLFPVSYEYDNINSREACGVFYTLVEDFPDYQSFHQSNFKYANIFEKKTDFYQYDINTHAFNMVKSMNNYYSNNLKSSINGLVVKRQLSPELMASAQKACYFEYFTYTIDQLFQKLDSTNIKEYFGVGKIMNSTTAYTYNNLGLPVRVTKSQSDGTLMTTYTKYPPDYFANPENLYETLSSTSNFPPVGKIESMALVGLVVKNQLSIPIETLKLKDSKVISGSLTEFKDYSEESLILNHRNYPYKQWQLQMQNPVTVTDPNNFMSAITNMTDWTFTKSSFYTTEPEVINDAYDNSGNILQLHKNSDINISVIWGYNNTLPVAKIIGTNYSTAIGLLTASDITKLNNNPTDEEVRAIIQEIRGHATMSNVLVTTYTYKPLTGMTSATDENGRITYYEYDDYGRLSIIRDNELNILKKYTYHYKGQ